MALTALSLGYSTPSPTTTDVHVPGEKLREASPASIFTPSSSLRSHFLHANQSVTNTIIEVASSRPSTIQTLPSPSYVLPNGNRSDSEMAFNILALVLALAGVLVAYLQLRQYHRLFIQTDDEEAAAESGEA